MKLLSIALLCYFIVSCKPTSSIESTPYPSDSLINLYKEYTHNKLTILNTWLGENIEEVRKKIVIDNFQFINYEVLSEKDRLANGISLARDHCEVIKMEIEVMSKAAKLDKTFAYTYPDSIKVYQKRLQKFEVQTDSLESLKVSADSIVPVAYKAKCIYSAVIKGKIKKDTIGIFTNLSYLPIKRSQLIWIEFFNYDLNLQSRLPTGNERKEVRSGGYELILLHKKRPSSEDLLLRRESALSDMSPRELK